MKTKIRKKNIRSFALIAIFLIVIGFGVGITEKVNAAPVANIGSCRFKCINEDGSYVSDNNFIPPLSDGVTNLITVDECGRQCNTKCPAGQHVGPAQCYFAILNGANELGEYETISIPQQRIAAANREAANDICGGTWNGITNPIQCLLLYILAFISWLLKIASSLLKWSVDAKNIQLIINNTVIYDMWKLVRDMLNISFILFLLFSAFATVFQVDKYSYKKILLNLVIMALLVNFSYPITRFIIDLSNVLMLYLVDALNLTSNVGADLASNSQLSAILAPETKTDSSIVFLLIAVVFGFVFTVSVLTIAVMLVIRIIALAILIIFSSLAFIGQAITPLSSYSSDWWKQLFNYAFFGPIMIFFLIVATRMMAELSRSSFGNINQIAIMDSANPEYLAVLCIFIIPIIIMWIGLGTAQKMSIAGASAVVGKAQGMMKSVGNYVAKAPYRLTKAGINATGIPGGAKEGWNNFKKTGRLFGGKVPLYGGSNAREAREAKFAGLTKGGKSGWTEASMELDRKKTHEIRKGWKEQGVSDADIDSKLATGTTAEKKAAALEMSERKGFNDLTQYQNAAKALENDPALKKIFDDKAKEKHVKFVIENEISNISKTGKTRAKIYEDALGGMSAEQLAKQKGLHEEIGTNRDLNAYVISEIVPDSEFHKEYFKRLTKEQRQAYIDAGLNP